MAAGGVEGFINCLVPSPRRARGRCVRTPVDVNVDIDLRAKLGGLLDFRHDLSCTAMLSVSVGNPETMTITVASGRIDEFKPRAV